MSIFSMLYALFIEPLELIFEVIFSLVYRIVQNPGVTIIFLSLAVNFLVLPLYNKADAMQAEEKETEKKLNKWVTHIKKTFKGDERFMMLQTYYRQNNYKPTDALKGSVSLLLQIPFFIAAYNFLSGLNLLQGVSFGPIKNLGAPDGMLVIGGIAINVLPILMTLINIVSGIIYTKGSPLKAKIQLYGMALIFLVLLYTSPAGLVFYWTLNNVFSLVKNIFVKLKNPKLALCSLASFSSIALFIYFTFINPLESSHRTALVYLLLALLQIPIISYFVSKKAKSNKEIEISKQTNTIFFMGTIFMSVITGLLIPSTLIKASPQEFISISSLTNPLVYILHSFLIASGIFIVWFSIFYALVTPAVKRIMSYGMWVISGVAVMDYMFFGKNYGLMSNTLKFDVFPSFTAKEQIINLIAILILSAVLLLILKKKELVKNIYGAAIIATLALSLIDVFAIKPIASETIETMSIRKEDKPHVTLSKNGKNVIVIMMDRGYSPYIPYIFNEKPELKEQFAGFTYYPNTISYGPSTNSGSPVLYGGYDYIPDEMDRRSDKSLKEKQNEALKVMPVLFNENGYDVTIFDPTYANYSWIPDLSIYDEYPGINKYLVMSTFDYTEHINNNATGNLKDTLMRNLFWYGIFKVSPTFLQPTIYNDGFYNDTGVLLSSNMTPTEAALQNPSMLYGQTMDGVSKASGLSHTFLNAYGPLSQLDEMTEISDSDKNVFFMMSNDTTHEPTILKEPEYEPAMFVDNTEYDAAHADRFTLNGKTIRMDLDYQMAHYHSNMAAMIKLGEYMDFLRENDLYDNTRIIIVSDHGRPLHPFEELTFGENELGWDGDVTAYNPLLMVKDFNSNEFTTDNQFMTNGDVPTIATNDLIQNPVNPFTNNPINSDTKLLPEQHIVHTYWDIAVNNGNTFSEETWITLKGHNIFDASKWSIKK